MTNKMRLNELSPATPRRRKRVGRGIGSGLGKTSGRGHKGQRSRAGGKRDVGFEGGQMPLHRRLPKRGFNSRLAHVTLRLPVAVLQKIAADEVTPAVLRESGIAAHYIKRIRLFASGRLERAVTVTGIAVSRGAKAQIEAAGGKIGQTGNTVKSGK